MFTAIVLVAIVWHFVLRSRQTLGGMLDWIEPTAAASAGSIYCVVIAANFAGRTKPGSISWIKRIGGLATPVMLIPTAMDLVKDDLVDPYAGMRDRAAWFVAAGALIIFSLWVASLTILHWDKTRSAGALQSPASPA